MVTEVLTAQTAVSVGTGRSATEHKKHDVKTKLRYWDDPGDGSRPTPIYVGKGHITNERPTTLRDVTIVDVAGDEESYTLSSHGFQYLRRKSKEKDFIDESIIMKEYYPECIQLLKDVTGGNRVHIFDHKVRRGPTHWHHLGVQNLANRGPVTRVHVDQSYVGAELLLRWELPDDADELIKKRYQIINVWRPIEVIEKDPIAVADAHSVPDSDLVGGETIHPDHRLETWTVRPGPEHRWHFKSQLSPEEVLLIKCFDTDTSVARRVPHSAFEDPEHADKQSRQSVEVRCFVFHDS